MSKGVTFFKRQPVCRFNSAKIELGFKLVDPLPYSPDLESSEKNTHFVQMKR